MNVKTFSLMQNYVLVTCYKCGVGFGLGTVFDQTLQRNGNTFWCPNGHSQVYTDGTDARLKKAEAKIAALRADLDQAWAWGSDVEKERKKIARVLGAERAAKTRLKLRVEGGVCIHCHRTFASLAKHMKTKHADVLGGEDTPT